jgi:F420-dependent oxidoreductase-like protein
MRFSVWPSPVRPWSEILATVQHAEETGWDGCYFADHFMPNTEDDTPADGPTIECWAVLAALAASTQRIRIGPLVCGNTYRHPAVLAKIAAAVDNVSGGRIVLGLGAGWQVNEHEAYGIPLFGTKERIDRFEEACEIVTGLLGPAPRFTFAGEHYQITDAPCDPKPVQQPLPLLVGGGGEKRMLRIAARFADEWNVWGTAELLRHKIGVLERHCADLGRDPATIQKSANAILFLSNDEAWLAGKRSADSDRPTIIGTPSEVRDIVQGYVEAGVDELIIPDFNLGPLARRLDTYDLFVEEVAAAFR